MKIVIKTIPHNQQRYETVGDWYFEQEHNLLTVKVSSMRDKYYEFLVAFHEIIEATLCMKRAISEKEVTLFDLAFELKRPEGNTDEPGDDPSAPYKNEHAFATKLEKLMADELDVVWEDYEKAVNSL